MKKKLLNSVKPAPDERYCDWTSRYKDGEKCERCINAPRYKMLTDRGTIWKLCGKHKELLLSSYNREWYKKEEPLWRRF